MDGVSALAAVDARANGSNGTGASPNGNGTSTPLPRVSFEQLSFPGTTRGPDGLAYPDEFIRELQDPIRRMEIFEEMGHDGAVATAIEARCQDVYAANWDLASEDKTEKGKAILAYVADEIDRVIEDLLRWLAEGPLQYGFAAIEPVFGWKTASDGEQRLGILRLAHLRQVTCEMHITETGELDYIQQHVWTGTSQRDPKIPAARLIVRTLKREGADYYGKPPLRKFYREWRFKTQLEKINVHHFDKFGGGVPIVTEPEGGLPDADRQLLDKGLDAMRAGAMRIRVPFGTKLELLTGQGDLAGAELEWVQYYDGRVQKIVLTQGVDLGTTQTGSRAVGETFADQLQGAVQADAENIAAIILEQLIKPLVILNFGEQEHYPEFSPSARAKATTALFDNLTKAKTAGVLHPRPEDEVTIRDMLGMAPVPLEQLQQEEKDRVAQAAAIAKATPGSPASSAAGQSGRPPAARTPPTQPAQRVAASLSGAVRQLVATLADGAPPPAIPGESSHRTPEFSEWEARVLAPFTIIDQLDLQTSRFASELQDILRAIDDDLEKQAIAAANDGAASLQAIQKSIAVPDRLRKRLRSVALEAAQRARDYGQSTVYTEVQRQLGPEGVGAQRTRAPKYPSVSPMYSRVASAISKLLALAAPGDSEKTPRDLRLEASVDEAVEAEIGRREQSTLDAIRTALTQAAGLAVAVLASVLSTALRQNLSTLSTNVTQSNVQSVVNIGFGAGRSDAADAINAAAAREKGEAVPATAGAIATPDGRIETIDEAGQPITRPAPARSGGGGARSGLLNPDGSPIELVGWYYSAAMDFATCDPCATWDGGFFPIDYPDDITGVQCPNPKCEGTEKRCRFVKIFVTDREAPANVGPTKGPVAQ